ncbi:N-acyl homoserine lactonase family protein [Robertmurraya yapensis]|uniref:N-acyl homoserine lactonase family protein n=1 Tax=Bacillus yapensis TaxID=2492960 RepID=A0A431VXZ1_9BACI|nr:N-acyl homoserine lactonase family protein [Bacillus yapensis]RTR28167.1 N-acyl homoserine lactonase family protein [Bacillus yapensis]TKS94410.1 MBL fold metallo-hydrolase [Bacillus yapensis]
MEINIHRIQTGTVQLHREHVENKGNFLYWLFFTDNWIDPVPINAYLIEHPKGLVLFDTGEDPEINDSSFSNRWDPSRKISQMNVKKEDSIVHGLNNLGYAVDDIKYVVLSHLHSDHIGGMKHFSNASFVINEREWRDGNKLGVQFFSGYQKSRFNFPRRKYRIIHFQKLKKELEFKVGHDLFDDGSLILVPTPGHTHGHQSMLINGKTPICLAGDAIFSQKHLKDTIPFAISTAKSKSPQTIRLLREWSYQNKNAPILSGHDPEASILLSKWKAFE